MLHCKAKCQYHTREMKCTCVAAIFPLAPLADSLQVEPALCRRLSSTIACRSVAYYGARGQWRLPSSHHGENLRTIGRKRPWWFTAMSTSHVDVEAGVPTTNEADGTLLPLAAVGVGSHALGVSIAEHYGWRVRSINELLTGRKGRRTSAVKARVVAQWLDEDGGERKRESRPRHSTPALTRQYRGSGKS